MGKNRSYSGVPGGIRTHDPLLRRQPLYPAELQGHRGNYITIPYLNECDNK